MAAESLLYLGNIGIILLIGIFCTILANRLKIPNYLILIITGIIIGSISFRGEPIISFSPTFLTAIAILALVMIVFDASSRLKLKTVDSLTTSAFSLGIVFLIVNFLVLAVAAYLVVGIDTVLLALLFSSIVSGTAPSVILSVMKKGNSKVFDLLEVESIINTPLVVLIPFLIIDFINQGVKIDTIGTQIIPFIQQFVAAIGTGVIVGLIFFKFMRKQYSETLSPAALLTAALLTYVLAEYIGGNGVLAVTTAGLFFGNIFLDGKRKLQEFSFTISFILEILVFLVIGIVIKIPFSAKLFIQAAYLFGISILIRSFCVQMLFAKSDYTFKEKVFMSLNIPKGIAVAVVALSLAVFPIAGLVPVLNLVIVFMIYSIVLSTIATHYSKYFTKIDVLEEAPSPKSTRSIGKGRYGAKKKSSKRKTKKKR